jgi:valyl-tRNA synthetase
MLHPHMPFVSEQIYQDLYQDKKSLLLEQWPKVIKLAKFDTVSMQVFIDVYTFARNLRIDYGIKNTNKININVITSLKIKLNHMNDVLASFNVTIDAISSKRINQTADIETFNKMIIEYVNTFENPEEIKNNLQKELTHLTNEINRSKQILANANFIAKAPADKVNAEKQKLAQYEQRYKEIMSTLKQK